MVLPGGSKHPANKPGGIGVNGGINGGASITHEDPQTKNRYTTHIVLSDSRVWQKVSGGTAEGKLLAFEDVVTETPAGSKEPPPVPVPPANPTVVRNGKIRLQVGKQAFEIELISLVKADQDFIEGIRAALAKKAAPKP